MRRRFEMKKFLIFSALVLGLSQVQGKITLNPNGGYDFSVAIATGTNQPRDVDLFIQNITKTFEMFSELLHSSSQGTFFINSVNLIVPNYWEVTMEGVPTAAVLDNYNNAAVRLAKSIEAPFVNNPNMCGLPGQYIGLPIGFFQETCDMGKYGCPARALLAAWARYRWGTWEEHGYPGDKRFPYFYKPEESGPWVATGCSDEELDGELQNIRQQDRICNDIDEHYPPSGDCRFIPSETSQNATSSLSYFHWLESVTSFCTEDNHNKDAPNKQNLFCDYQSVTQVMESSPDRAAVTSPEPVLPPLEFKISMEAKKPLFYLLVDGSKFTYDLDPAVYTELLAEVKVIFSHRFFTDIPGKASVFPSATEGQALDEVLPWGDIFGRFGQFSGATDLFRTGTKSPTDFAAALSQVIYEIESVGNPVGAAILVLKHGAATSSIGNDVFETELGSRLRASNIKLSAIEIQVNAITPQLNFENLATSSGGYYFALTPALVTLVGSRTKGLITNFMNDFENFPASTTRASTMHKRYIKNGDKFDLPLADLPEETVIRMSVTLSNAVPWNGEDRVIFPETNIVRVILSSSYEWNDRRASRARRILTHIVTVPSFSESDVWTFSYTACAAGGDCDAWLVVTYEYPLDYVSPPSDVDVEVTLSEVEVDFTGPNANKPIQVFARITQNGQPVLGVTEVVVDLHSQSSRTSFLGAGALRDDGSSSVDVSVGDGIYSGIVKVPSDDPLNPTTAKFTLTVSIRGTRLEAVDLEDHVHMDSAVQRILPKDQVTVGCTSDMTGCAVTGLEIVLLRYFEVPQILSVTGAASMPVQAARILDLDAVALSDFVLRLSWTVPNIIGTSETPDVDFVYEIKYSDTPEQLRTEINFGRAESYPQQPGDTISYVPGERCTVTITTLGDSGRTYFAVRLSHNPVTADHTPPSNIRGVTPVPTEIITTTTTTTRVPPPIDEGDLTTESPTSTDGSILSSTMETSTTAEGDKFKYWFQTTWGIVTLSIFAGAVVLLVVAFLLYRCFATRSKSMKAKARREAHPYNNF